VNGCIGKREKWIGIEPKELVESSAERNRKFRLTKGTKKGRRQRTQEKESTLTGIYQENITIGRKKIFSPFNKSDFTSTQFLNLSHFSQVSHVGLNF